ncbi:hypothetical protein Nocox_39575 [Nonomuraea coxensis DSM 45129]|uniref:Uncharacterized protein n=1 Tax=Nonomuraea coxensis DSM 45129 TaxID=1122611 RepID=A0ABX8UGD9_9ACTN|nr:hypothetical protein Nocox_39575 [Nonomuraea coxensis DSM 45129]
MSASTTLSQPRRLRGGGAERSAFAVTQVAERPSRSRTPSPGSECAAPATDQRRLPRRLAVQLAGRAPQPDDVEDVHRLGDRLERAAARQGVHEDHQERARERPRPDEQRRPAPAPVAPLREQHHHHHDERGHALDHDNRAVGRGREDQGLRAAGEGLEDEAGRLHQPEQKQSQPEGPPRPGDHDREQHQRGHPEHQVDDHLDRARHERRDQRPRPRAKAKEAAAARRCHRTMDHDHSTPGPRPPAARSPRPQPASRSCRSILKTGKPGATACTCSSDALASSPSKNLPTSHPQRFR